jgi:hypothetical protein
MTIMLKLLRGFLRDAFRKFGGGGWFADPCTHHGDMSSAALCAVHETSFVLTTQIS